MKSAFFTLVFALFAWVAGAVEVTLTFTSPTCNGFTDGTATATPSGGSAPYAYAWSNGQSGQTTQGVAAGVYTVTVTDQTGATVVGTVNVTQPEPLVLSFTQAAPNCSSYEPVTAVVSGGIAPLAYQWSTGGTTATIAPTGSGNVFLTVTDARGCAVANTYYVPVPSQIFTSYFAVPPTCFGGSNGTVTPNIIGNYTPLSWAWSTGSQPSASLSGVASGTYTVTITDQQGCTKVDEAYVPTQAPLQVLPFMTNAKCHGTPSGVGTVLGAGGVSPYTYAWSNGAQEQIIQNLSAGSYTVTLTDGNQCTATAVGIVTEPAPLTNTVVSVTPACGNSGSITVQPAGGTPPYNVVWNGGQYTGTTVNNLPAGTYYVCTFDANNCQLDVVVELPGGPGLQVALNMQKADCAGIANGIATAIVSGGTGNYQYTWSNGGPNYPQQTGLAVGTTITVTVVDLTTGCTGTATGTIQTHTQIAIQVTDTDVFCPSDSTGTASVIAVSGTAPYTYNWTVNGTIVGQQNLTGLPAGAYPVTVTDATGCKAFGVADIGASGAANADFGVNTLYCEGDTIVIKLNDLSTANGQQVTGWNWTVSWGTGSTSFNVQTPPAIPVPANATGLVQLSVTTANGCTDVVAHPFTVGEDVNVSIASTDPVVNCTGNPSTIEVSGDPTYTYTWFPANEVNVLNNNPQTVQVNPAQNATYQLVATKAGCSDTLMVNVIKSPPFVVDLGAPVIGTCDTTQPLTATLNIPLPNVNVVWYNAAGDTLSTAHTYLAPATTVPALYSVLVTDQNGCSSTDQVSVVSNALDLQADIMSLDTVCANTPVQAAVVNLDPNDILLYGWAISPTGATVSDPVSANPIISATAMGTYTLTVNVANQYGCTQTLSTDVVFSSSANLNNLVETNLCNGLEVEFTNGSSEIGVWAFGDGSTSTTLSPTHTYATAGQYIVSFTPNNSCYQPYQDTIQVLPTAAVEAAIQSVLADCQNVATVTFTDLSQHTSDIATWTWTFSTGQTSNEPNPTVVFPQEGTITAVLSIQDVNGCVDDSAPLTLEIDIVNEEINSNAGFCPGGATELNPNPNTNYTYNWTASPADPSLVSTQPNPTVSPTGSTVYTVQIVNGTCTVDQTIAVEVYPPADVLASRDTVVCNDNAVQISAFSTNAVSFAWANTLAFDPIFSNSQTTMAAPTTMGMNYVRATTIHGCTAVDSVMVLISMPNVVPSTIDPTYVCNGVSATIAVINNDPNDQLTYTWSGGLPNAPVQAVSPTTPTTYTVVVTDQYGCTESLSFAVSPVNVSVGLIVTGDTTICPGVSVALTANPSGGIGYTYLWSPDNSLDVNNAQTVVATPDTPTDYVVVVTDNASGCTAEGTTFINVVTPECIDPFIFVPNAFTPNGDNSNDLFRVRGVNMTELYFVVWDRWGEKVYETDQVNHTGWDGIFKGVASTPDAYAWYARVRCGNGQFWEKKGNVTLIR